MSVLIDAATEYINIADNAKFTWTPVTQERTLVLYWKTTSLPNLNAEYQTFLILDQSGGNKAQFAIYNNAGTNVLIANFFNSAWTNIGAFYCVLPSVTSDTWYQIVFGCSSNGNCVIRWNGANQTVSHSSWDDTTSINPSSIRISNGTAISDNMTVAHLAWFSGLLTQTQTENLRTNPFCMDAESACLLSLHLDEDTGTTAHDAQTQNTATNGTLTNTPTWATDPDTQYEDRFNYVADDRWDWAYGSGTGYQNCPVSEGGRTVCEIGITDSTSDSVYSDGNLQEVSETHDGGDYAEWILRTDGCTQGTYGWGMWNGNVGASSALWFWWGDDNNDIAYRELRAMIINDGSVIFNQALSGIDTSEYHIYQIVRGSNFAVFKIDGVVVVTYSGTMPDDNMRYETWVDNAYYQSGTRYLEAVDHYQRIYIDTGKYIEPAVFENGTYSAEITESNSITDAITNAAIFGTMMAESATISDGESTTGIFSVIMAELISISENISNIVHFISAISESNNITDVQNAVVEFLSAISESANISDQQVGLNNIPVSISENISIVDYLSTLAEFICAISENQNIIDLFQSFTGDNLIISESVGVSDNYTNIATLLASISESITAHDNLSAIVTLLANISESTTIADLISAGNIYLESVNETVAISDLVSLMTAISKYISATMTIKNKLSASVEIKGIVSGELTKTGKISGVLQ